MADYFQYGQKEIVHLKRRYPKLAVISGRIGIVERSVFPDLFTALVTSVSGQQIPTKAHPTIWGRRQKGLSEITPAVIDFPALEKLQQFGIMFKKEGGIKSIAQKIITGELRIRPFLPDPVGVLRI